MTRIYKAACVMSRAEQYDSSCWQSASTIMTTEYALLSNEHCTADFSVHLAISEEFRDLGATVNYKGAPVFRGQTGSKALAKMLQISDEEARYLNSIEDLVELQHVLNTKLRAQIKTSTVYFWVTIAIGIAMLTTAVGVIV